MRLLYLYPEEWTGRLAREVHSLATCIALAGTGIEVTLVTAGGAQELEDLLLDMGDRAEIPGLHLVTLSRTLGPLQSTSIFSRNLNHWLQECAPFNVAYSLHLKAGPILRQAGIPFVYEAHEIVVQTAQSATRQRLLHKLEGHVLSTAALCVATSTPLAMALSTWFSLSNDFAIVPSAGFPPLDHSISAPDGPFVYSGSIADWRSLAGIVDAARDTGLPLKIVGGTEEEWRTVGEHLDTGKVEWRPRVRVSDLPEVFAGARAGLIPTNPDVASGEFSCPMKLFDYTRCGLQVLSTALPSLQNLDVGLWCTQVPSPARLAWVEAMQKFRHDANQADAARAWSAEHTWAKRAELLLRVFGF